MRLRSEQPSSPLFGQRRIVALVLGAALVVGCHGDGENLSSASASVTAEPGNASTELSAPEAAGDPSSVGSAKAGARPFQRIGTRSVLGEALDTLWHRGGAVDDSLLQFPFTMEVGDSLVYLFDRGAMRIVAFDAGSGELRWTFGRRGKGPGEFGDAVTLALGPSDGLRFFDRANMRFMDVSSDGQLQREWVLPSRRVSHTCALTDGTTLIAADTYEPPSVLWIGEYGDTLRNILLPWAGLDTVNDLARQARMAPTGNGRECIFAFAMGRGFARLGPEGVAYAARYVEHFDLAATVTRRVGAGTGTSFADNTVYATYSPSVDRDTLVVLFMGADREYYQRFLDHYDANTGEYLYSRLLDTSVGKAVRANGIYYVFKIDGDYPSLTALRPRPQ